MNAVNQYDLCWHATLILGHFLWQGTAIAILAWLAAMTTCKSAAARYRVYITALCAMGLCPIVTWKVMRFDVSVISHPPPIAKASEIRLQPMRISALRPAGVAAEREATPQAALPITSTKDAPLAARPPVEQVSHRTSSDSLSRYVPLIVATYVLGVAVMLARLALAIHGGHQLRKRSIPIVDSTLLQIIEQQCRRLRLRFAPPIATSQQVIVPVLVGIIRPMILLPAALLSGLTNDQIEAILAHELVHLARRDHLLQLLQRVIECVLFFHPAVWFVSSQIHTEREHCCDDLAASLQGSAREYARSLVRVAELCLADAPGARSPAMALAAIGRPSPLKRRVTRLIQGRSTPQVRVSRAWVFLAIVALMLSTSLFYRRSNVRAAESKATSQPSTQPTTQPTRQLSGTLVDPQNRPVGNACIAAAGENYWFGARSDVNGRFTVNIKPTDHHVVAYSQRRSQMVMFNADRDMSKPIVFNQRAAGVDGRVVDASGNPVAGAWARVFVIGADGTSDPVLFPTYEKTDKSGYFGTGDLPSAAGLKIFATLSDNPTDVNHTEVVNLTGQPQIELPDLVVRTTTAPSPKPGPERVRYSGRIVNEQGEPIAGVEVSMSYPSNHMITEAGTVTTDQDGRFSRLMPPDAQSVEFRLIHPDYVSFHFADTPSPAISALRDGSAVLKMKRGASIEGKVVDDQGKPVCNALVAGGRLYSSSGGNDSELIEDATSPRTDVDGSFRIGGLPEGQRELFILADGFAPQVLLADVHADSAPVTIQLARGLNYSGQVIDCDGNPLGGATVGAEDWTAPDSRDRHPITRFSKTDDQGRFTITGLPNSGSLLLYANKKGFMTGNVSWSADGKENPQKIKMFPPPVVMGKVVDDATDQPIAAFDVEPGWYWKPGERFDHSDFDGTMHVKSADGKFSKQIDRVIMGQESLDFAARIVAKGYIPQITPSIKAGQKYEPFVIRLIRGTPIAGTILTPDGKPATSAQVIFVHADDDTWVQSNLKLNEDLSYTPHVRAKTDKEGKFELSPQESAGRLLVLHNSGYALIEDPTSLKPDAPITLAAWARVEGMVLRDGKPAASQLALSRVDPRIDPSAPHEVTWQLKTASRPDGRFVIEHVPAMPFVLTRLDDQGYQTGGTSIDPKPGETVTLTLGEHGVAASGTVDLQALQQKVDTEWVRVCAYRIDPSLELPAGWKDPGSWDAMLAQMKTAMPGFDSALASFGHSGHASADGTLTVPDLDPGHYVLHVEVHAPPVPNICGWGTVLATGRAEFDVPANSASPVALPPVSLRIEEHPEVGQPAPEITSTTFVGDAFALSKRAEAGDPRFLGVMVWSVYGRNTADQIVAREICDR